MAKQVQLKQNGVEIYPQTITQAIADTTRNKLLSVILTDIENSVTAETANRIAAIQGLDRAAITKSGEYIVSVSETDGVVSATTKQVEASEVKNESSKVAISAATNVQGALDALADKAAAITILNEDGTINVTPSAAGTDINVNIKSGDLILSKSAGSGITSTLNLVKITNDLPATVKERYQLQGIGGTVIGANVDIAKDSHIVSINYITTGEHAQNLEYVYIDASGVTQTTYVDMSSLVLEAEFASGVTITNHIAHGVVDPASESFLSVGAAGFKLSGVQDAITSAVQALDADESGATDYIKVQVTENDGKVDGVTVSDVKTVIATSGAMESLAETGHLADAKAVKDYVDAKTGSLDSKVSGQTANGFIKVEVNQADGALDYVKVTGTTQDVATATSSNKGLAEASDVKAYVDGQINALDATVSGQSGAVKVEVTEADGKLTGVAVTATTTSMAEVTASTPADNLAKAKDVKDYVDSAATKNTIIDSADIDATVAATGTTLAIKYGSIASGATSAVTGGNIFAWGVTAEDKGDVTVTWPTA